MSAIAFPAALTSSVMRMNWSLVRNDMEFRSGFGAQAVEISSPLWAALLMQLRGKTNQLELWDIVRPAPLGTMRGSMVLNSNAAQGATLLSIFASGEDIKTLLQGDLLGIGDGLTQQVVMVMEDAVSDGSGIILITIEPPLRNAFTGRTGSPPAGGEAVTWDKPKALFRRQESKSNWDYGGAALVGGFRLDLLEDVRP